MEGIQGSVVFKGLHATRGLGGVNFGPNLVE